MGLSLPDKERGRFMILDFFGDVQNKAKNWKPVTLACDEEVAKDDDVGEEELQQQQQQQKQQQQQMEITTIILIGQILPMFLFQLHFPTYRLQL